MKKTHVDHYDIVEVEWLDASSNSAFLDVEAAKEVQDLICFSVGYLLRKDKHSVRINQTFVPNLNEAGKLLEVPMGIVRRITVLRKGKKK
jgi:hypothetical protein